MMPDGESQLNERVTQLEIYFTHLEHRCQQLHDVLLESARRLENIEAQLRSMADRHVQLESRLAEPRDPAAEKPPHY
jgi:uncharacterized coiled-coil protein SlyX